VCYKSNSLKSQFILEVNFFSGWSKTRDGPWPDPTRAYFWPAVNKRPTRLQHGYLPTQPKAIFFAPKGKKLNNLIFLRGIFEIQTQTINGWPNPTRVKTFDPDPSLSCLDRMPNWNHMTTLTLFLPNRKMSLF